MGLSHLHFRVRLLWLYFFWVGSLTISFPTYAWQPESTFMLQPRLRLESSREGGFDLSYSSFRQSWKNLNQTVTVGLGTKDLVDPGLIFSPFGDSLLALSDFYWAQQMSWGIFRVGYQPNPFSLEGGGVEGQPFSHLSYSMRNRWFGLRQLGVSFHLESDGFFTNFMLANGEGPIERDNLQWVVGQWGYRSDTEWQVGLGGMTGATNPASTQSSLDDLWNVAEEARHRWGQFFLAGSVGVVQLRAEAYVGSILQRTEDKARSSWYLLAKHPFFGDWRLEWMYENVNLDHSLQNKSFQSASMEFSQSSDSSQIQTSFLYRHQEGAVGTPSEDEVFFIWRVSPQI
jgi:hypothetical protein